MGAGQLRAIKLKYHGPEEMTEAIGTYRGRYRHPQLTFTKKEKFSGKLMTS
jgi:hypothetical protein